MSISIEMRKRRAVRNFIKGVFYVSIAIMAGIIDGLNFVRMFGILKIGLFV